MEQLHTNWITIDLLLASIGGILGALSTIAKNDRKESISEAITGLLNGLVFGAAAGTYFGKQDPILACLIGLVIGSSAGILLEVIQRFLPEATKLWLRGLADRIGGKTHDNEK